MCNLAENVRGSADNLDSAGQNTASIGKGYAIAGAAFVALALFGAYLLVAGSFENTYPINFISISTPIILAGLLIGSILPHAFIANINSAVNKGTDKLVSEVN
jgi:K(+)-stimulated pyrophosphate-energized sodium pump